MLDKGPVIVGGIGGSGTRIIAEMLKVSGYFIGNDLNQANDNLSYTLLFKRPAWFIKNFNNPGKFFTGLNILEKSMITGKALTLSEKLFLRRAVLQMSWYGHNREGEGRGKWAYTRKSFIDKPHIPIVDHYIGWGWKEPNSHLLIPVFNSYFPDFQYIHLVRHGLDMAFSSNQQQLFNWACLFNIDLPEAAALLPQASLHYWVEANKRVLSLAEHLGSDKLLILNFDALCCDPISGIKSLFDFLKIDLSENQYEKVVKLPVIPESSGRYKLYPQVNFNPGDIAFVESMGFSCTY